MTQALTLAQIEEALALQALRSWLDGAGRRWDPSILRGAILALGGNYSEAEERVSNLVQNHFNRAEAERRTITQIERELSQTVRNIWA